MSKNSLTEQQYSNTEIEMNRFKHMINNNGQIPAELKTKKFFERLHKLWGKALHNSLLIARRFCSLQ